MIIEVSGDILLTKAKSIAHSVAPLDHFESGLALGLREKYPEMVKDFRHEGHVHHMKSGEIYEWTGRDGFKIFSLLVQEAAPSTHSHGLPGKASLHNLDRCLKQLASKLESEGITSIALPRVATGVGGLDWDDVRPHIYKYLDV
ncbi:MAG: macro domain-containing protein, partial [Saprospiraceae bacterium]|nr:macro domain-containing protein [Saprospiraceae bacterium]